MEVEATGVIGVLKSLPAGQQGRTIADGVGNEALKALERGVGDHGTDVSVEAEAQGADARLKHLQQPLVGGGRGDDALDADAVLAGGLEAAPQQDLGDAGQVGEGGVEDDGGVLPAELRHERRQAARRGRRHVVAHGAGADEGHVRDARVAREVVGDLGPADDGLDEGRVVAVGHEGAPRNARVVRGAPAGLLADFDHDAVPGEDGTDDGAHQVVERVVPADEGGDDAEGLVAHLVALVGHEEVRGAAAGAERRLAVLDSPLQLLGRDEDLAELGVEQGLAGVEGANTADLVLVGEDVTQHRAQHLAPLVERRRGPLRLRRGSLSDGAVDAGGRRGVDEAQELPRRRCVTLDGGGSGDLDRGWGFEDRVLLGSLRGRDRVPFRLIEGVGVGIVEYYAA